MVEWPHGDILSIALDIVHKFTFCELWNYFAVGIPLPRGWGKPAHVENASAAVSRINTIVQDS